MSNSKPHFDAEGQPDGKEIGGAYTVEFTPRQLNIVWGNDSRYWELPDKNQKEKPATLLQVSWLEVTGSTKSLGTGTYTISFDVALKAGAFGWSGCPLFMMAKVGKKGRYSWKRLTVPNDGGRTELPSGNDKLEIKVTSDDQIYFGLYEVWTGKWKGGLEIYNAKVKKTSS